MSERIGNWVVVEEEPESTCEYCGKKAETRPYGRNGARICYECGMKNEEETNKNMGKILFGEEDETLN